MTSLLFTDDEVLAIAVDSAATWPYDLPTVDLTDPQSSFAATFRGLRSLRTRELLDDAGHLDLPGGHPVLALPGARAFLRLYLGGDDLHRRSWALDTVSVPTSAGWASDMADVRGIHRTVDLTDDEHRSGHLAMLRAGLDETLDAAAVDADDPAGPPWVCVIAAWEGGSRLLAARAGELVERRVEGEEVTTVRLASTSEALERAYAGLIAAVRRESAAGA